MDNNQITGLPLSAPDFVHKGGHGHKKDERSTMGKIKDFFESQMVEKDKDSGDFKVNRKMYGVAAAETAVGGAVGYTIGADHQAADVVTHETIMKDVMKSVAVGEKTVTGGYHYHYGGHMDASSGNYEFGYHYGYDASWTHQETMYEQVPTGEKVPVHLTHHTQSAPYTALQGLALGSLIGGAIGVVTLAISKIIASGKNGY
jgi:hypothetical protein